MKKFLFHLFVFVAVSLSFECGLSAQGERTAQRLNVYIINFYSMPTLLQPGDFDSNNARVNPVFRIDIKEKNLIQEFQRAITPNQNWQRIVSEGQFTSRVVFDFIENEKIILSVSFDEYGNMTVNDDLSRIFYRNLEIMNSIERSFPLFIDFMK